MPTPMLASSGPPPADGSRWALEFKWDGARCLSRVAPGVVMMHSRNGNQLSAAFPEVAEALVVAAAGQEIIVDGELVAPTPGSGRPDFGRLGRRLGVVRPSRGLVAEVPVQYFVFDLLALNGQDLRGRAYVERRELLADLALDLPSPTIVVPPYWTDVGVDAMLAAAAEHGVEGVVAKRLDSAYRSGRSTLWRKVALRHHADVVVVGWLPRSGRSAEFGSLLVAAHDSDGRLVLLGTVGTGFTTTARRALQQQLAELAVESVPIDGDVAPELAAAARWVTPEIIGEVAFRERTAGGLRHPSWRGRRFDRALLDIVVPED